VFLRSFWNFTVMSLSASSAPLLEIPTSDQEDVIQHRIYTIYARSLQELQFLTSPTPDNKRRLCQLRSISARQTVT
jgi:hypothetical protein